MATRLVLRGPPWVAGPTIPARRRHASFGCGAGRPFLHGAGGPLFEAERAQHAQQVAADEAGAALVRLAVGRAEGGVARLMEVLIEVVVIVVEDGGGHRLLALLREAAAGAAGAPAERRTSC